MRHHGDSHRDGRLGPARRPLPRRTPALRVQDSPTLARTLTPPKQQTASDSTPLAIDEPAAEVVVRILDWFLGGSGIFAIAETPISPGDARARNVLPHPGGRYYYLAFTTPNGSNKHLAPGCYPWAQDSYGQLSRGRPGT